HSSGAHGMLDQQERRHWSGAVPAMNSCLQPQASTAPTPLFGPRDQACLDRIEIDVVQRRQVMSLVSNEPIPIVDLPECPDPPQPPVRVSCGEALPRAYDCTELPAGERREKNVNMIRHDRPAMQTVTISIEKQEGLLHTVGNFIAFQPAGA